MALTVLLAPLTVCLVFVLGRWQVAATILLGRIVVTCLLTNGGVREPTGGGQGFVAGRRCR